jgi:NAD(P)-dependent dehydrogenase (short-subunit alcohol dehydrogenase family)
MKSSPTEARPCAFITGAAHGIGAATARLFAARGWLVGAADLDEQALECLARELGQDRLMPLALDVRLPGDWTRALAAFHERAGRIDLLVNNAGILISGPFESSPVERHHAVVDVNVKGIINGCLLAKPYLAATPGSRVVNLSSAAATYGQASLATYSATKFAVRGLTEALNIEWQADGICVRDVMPLYVRTGMIEGLRARSIERLGVHLTPDDVARVVWQAAHYRGFARVHWPVGAAAAWMHRLTALSPDRLNRFVARLIGA